MKNVSLQKQNCYDCCAELVAGAQWGAVLALILGKFDSVLSVYINLYIVYIILYIIHVNIDFSSLLYHSESFHRMCLALLCIHFEG